MKRAVIVLGAGAPNAWGASLTSEITELILQDKNYKTKSGIPLAKFIYDNLAKYYNSTSSINFETIINSLETIQNYYMNKTVVGGNPNTTSSASIWFNTNEIIEELMNFKVEPEGDPERVTVHNLTENGGCFPGTPKSREETVYINHAIKDYLTIVKQQINIYSLNLNEPENNDLNTSLKELLMHILNQGYIPRIYTTNYDSLFPTIFNKSGDPDFFDGFDNQIGETPFGPVFKMNLPRILNDNTTPCYYNLHGCIFWEYEATGDDRVSQYRSTPNEAHLGTFINRGELTNPGENTLVHNIITGYYKLQRISLEPLNSFHSIFTQDCINAHLIITIGYSFSDYHINRPILNAIRINDTRLLHITFGNQYSTQVEEFSKIKDLLRLRDDFKSGTLHENGWIISDSRKQMVFHKGFKDFLLNNEWKNSNI
ncbi:hypothetical protein BH11BAC2_BH11BAC2_12380 [soil metagenome]